MTCFQGRWLPSCSGHTSAGPRCLSPGLPLWPDGRPPASPGRAPPKPSRSTGAPPQPRTSLLKSNPLSPGCMSRKPVSKHTLTHSSFGHFFHNAVWLLYFTQSHCQRQIQMFMAPLALQISCCGKASFFTGWSSEWLKGPLD